MPGKRQEKDKALWPFLDMMEGALAGIATGADFYEMLDEDIVWELPYHIPGGGPVGIAKMKGRAQIRDAFEQYGAGLIIDSMSDLVVRRAAHDDVVYTEYTSHGRATQTGLPYVNKYVTIITIKDENIVNVRDYWSPVIVLRALGMLDIIR